MIGAGLAAQGCRGQVCFGRAPSSQPNRSTAQQQPGALQTHVSVRVYVKSTGAWASGHRVSAL